MNSQLLILMHSLNTTPKGKNLLSTTISEEREKTKVLLYLTVVGTYVYNRIDVMFLRKLKISITRNAKHPR